MTLKEEFTTFVNTGAFTDLDYSGTIEKTADWWLSKFSEMIESERKPVDFTKTYCVTCGGHYAAGECDCVGFNAALDSLQAKIKS